MSLYDDLVKFRNEQRLIMKDNIEFSERMRQDFDKKMGEFLEDLLKFDNQFKFKLKRNGDYVVDHKKNWWMPSLVFTSSYYGKILLKNSPSILLDLDQRSRDYSDQEFFFKAIRTYFRKYIV